LLLLLILSAKAKPSSTSAYKTTKSVAGVMRVIDNGEGEAKATRKLMKKTRSPRRTTAAAKGESRRTTK